MLIIGCDYHPGVQQIAVVDTETGHYGERRLKHSDGEAEKFYRDLKVRGAIVRVGLEATGHTRWFERLLAELGYELWIGDAAQITAMRVRKQKTDRQDAQFLLKLLMEDRFPRDRHQLDDDPVLADTRTGQVRAYLRAMIISSKPRNLLSPLTLTNTRFSGGTWGHLANSDLSFQCSRQDRQDIGFAPL